MKVVVEHYGYDNLFQNIYYFLQTFSSNIHRYFNNSFHELKVPQNIIITENSNVDFHHKLIKFELFFFSSYIYIYIYMREREIKRGREKQIDK